MASLDFVFDLAEKLSNDNIDYFIVTIKPGKTETKADLFFDIRSEDALRSFESIFTTVAVEMEESKDVKHFYRKKKRDTTEDADDDEQFFL
jgi:hypothetical protein|tara:strand:+ start:87 stop:359 length:273 start_codon:yes stop_codon:yes gene_type:complete